MYRSIVGPAFSEGNNALVADSTVYHLNILMNDWDKESKNGKHLYYSFSSLVFTLFIRSSSSRYGRSDGAFGSSGYRSSRPRPRLIYSSRESEGQER